MFTLAQALPLAKQLEPKLSSVGYHLALGGSLLYKGTSEHDIDFFIYPHRENKEDVEQCLAKLSSLLRSEGYLLAEDRPQYMELDYIPTTRIVDNEELIVDFFLLTR